MTQRRRQLLERYGRKVAVGVLGGSLVAAGVVLMVLPGPGIAVALLGLAVLAREFSWARRALHWTRSRYRIAVTRLRRHRAERARRRVGRVDSPARHGRTRSVDIDLREDRTVV